MKFTLECLCIQMPPSISTSSMLISSSLPSALDAMQHILLTNEGESTVEVGSCQMLLHMHRGPSKLVLTHQAPVAREQKNDHDFPD